jgi:hypothetical protein
MNDGDDIWVAQFGLLGQRKSFMLCDVSQKISGIRFDMLNIFWTTLKKLLFMPNKFSPRTSEFGSSIFSRQLTINNLS